VFQNEYFEFFKISQRKHDDRCIVNAGMRVLLKDRVITDIALAFGGVSSSAILAQQTMGTLHGRQVHNETK
jgi:xanthine dehydrogenase/oxidase